MSEPTTTRLDEVALFRYGLIADLKDLPRGTKGLGKRLTEKASAHHYIPGSTRTRVEAETLRHWLRDYRNGGFDALKPKPRSDAGSSHALPQELVDRLCQLKEEKPELSVQLLIRELRDAGHIAAELPVAPSTVHRLLSRAGLMRKKSDGESKDRRRFTFERANDLWMSDVMHGPAVLVDGRVKRKAYLIAFIDDATRVVPFAAFALAESTSAFLPVLKQAIIRRGIPKRLYVDNGSAFRSQHLALACAKLGITLIHARPYQPQGKGKQERWFRTVRLQLLSRLSPSDTQSLEALNRRLWAYVEGEYHQTPHRGLDGKTPLDAWAERAAGVEYVGARADIEDLFLFEERRRVAKDRIVSLHGVSFEVDANLVGNTVILRFDPTRPRAAVQVFADGKRYADAKPVDTHANCFVRRSRAVVSLDGTKLSEPAPAQDGGTAVPTSQLRLADLAQSQPTVGQKEVR
jgi:transposase InsO family protein